MPMMNTRDERKHALHETRRRALKQIALGVGATTVGSLTALVGASHAQTPASGARSTPLKLTPTVTEGPFYPQRFPADVDNDLTRMGSSTTRARGAQLDLDGRLLDARGAPIANAQIEIWQCDQAGQYHHIGNDGDKRLDEGFQGYGKIVTDAEGRYTFRTIRPVAYAGRTPHIHYIVSVNERRRLTSQMFVEGEASNDRDGIFRAAARDAAARERLVLKLSGANDLLRGSLDIVIAA
jgi:protocatechuate 3,4-dioxygenase, beta subunit